MAIVEGGLKLDYIEQGSTIPGPGTATGPQLIGNWATEAANKYAKLHLCMRKI